MTPTAVPSPPHTPKTAVLLLAHGTPDVLGEMPSYLAHVTGGRPMPPEVVAELQHRYSQIGLGETPGDHPPPLTRWTFTQAHLLEQALAASGTPMPVYAAMRNWHPFIADVVHQIRADGVTRLIAICLAPQNSRTSIGLYRRALTAAIDSDPSDPIHLTFIEEWPEEPALIEAFAHRLLALFPPPNPGPPGPTAPSSTLGLSGPPTPGAPGSTVLPSTLGLFRPTPRPPSMTVPRSWAAPPNPVLFTAHSVPCRTIMTGEASIAGARPGTPIQSTPDPYPVQAKRTARLVFERAAREIPALQQWFFAFQSQGVAGGPWIGPTVEDTLKAIRDEGHTAVILQPIGFVCDHVEVLYDIDIAFTETARSLGLALYRPESLNDSPLLTEALLNVVRTALNQQQATGSRQPI